MIGAIVAGLTGSGGASLSSYESIATATGTGSSATITFSSIPSTFKHLQIRGIARGTANGGTTPLTYYINCNSDTGSNYAYHRLQGDGATASALGQATQTKIYMGVYADSGYSANIMGTMVVDILDYGSTSKYKTFRAISGVDDNSGTTGSQISLRSGLWMSTSAISTIAITNNGGDNFSTSTTFALYGIKEA